MLFFHLFTTPSAKEGLDVKMSFKLEEVVIQIGRVECFIKKVEELFFSNMFSNSYFIIFL
jgi:hypothetical protein